jgi:hypothetical protein
VSEVRLWLSVIADNLESLSRRLALAERIQNCSLTSLRQRLVKTSGGLVKHSPHYWLIMAEGCLMRQGFGSMLRMVGVLPLPGEW